MSEATAADTGANPATPAEPAPAQAHPAPPPPPRPARTGGVAWLALLLALLALGAVVFQAYQDRIESDLADFRTQAALQEQVGAIEQLRQRFADQRAEVRGQREQSDARFRVIASELAEQRQRMGELNRADRSAWQLAEAEYLLQLASQRLLLGGDAQSALRMLEQVDGIVRGLDDRAALPLRAALADDIAALRALPAIDLEGTYLALGAAAKQAQALRLIKPLALEEPAAEEGTPVPESWGERLQDGLGAALARLGELVQVRRRDEPYRALLAPQHEAALRHNLQLLFEQAQLALLAGNPRLFDQSLTKARDWLLTYYTLGESATQALATTVDELRQRPVTIELPDIAGSRRALKDYLDQRVTAPIAAPAAAETAP